MRVFGGQGLGFSGLTFRGSRFRSFGISLGMWLRLVPLGFYPRVLGSVYGSLGGYIGSPLRGKTMGVQPKNP